jgi:hypothetical protein
MTILTPGHRYELSNFEHPNNVQVLQFIEKYPSPGDETVLLTAHDGTTNEEVLIMLIDRMCFLQAKMPSRENAIVITKLEECLMWLNKRTAERKARDVEGTHKP